MSGAEEWSEARNYHGQPVLKEPVWTWEIPCYFYTGGLTGGSAALALFSELRGNDVLAKRAWGTALLGVTLSPTLLIMDLGKPARFLNMLRMFKVTSPMSVGSWILSGAGASTGLAALSSWTGLFPRLGKLAKPFAALLGMPLSTYTAALLVNTAVPAWHEVRKLMPFVFGSGAALSAGAAGVITTPPDRAAPARRLALGAAVAEGALIELMKKQAGGHVEAYNSGPASVFSNVSRGCIVTGTLLLARKGGSSRAAAVAAGTLLSAGALSRRWSIFKAGFNSARDPKYVVGPQREGIRRGERRGAARQESQVSTPDRKLGSPASSVS